VTAHHWAVLRALALLVAGCGPGSIGLVTTHNGVGQDGGAAGPGLDARTPGTIGRGDLDATSVAPPGDAQPTAPPPDGRAAAVDGSSVTVDGSAQPTARTDGCAAGAPLPLDRVRLYPVQGGGAQLVGARFQGSNEGTTSGFVDLATIEQAPADGTFTELKFANATLFRYVRFFDPQGRPAPLAEIQFFHGGIALTGRAFGTSDGAAADHGFAAALDGDTATWYRGATAGGNYAGLDIAGDFLAAVPTFSPGQGALTAPTDVTVASTTKGARLRFTRDASLPSASNGEPYTKPIRVEAGRTTLRAIAEADCFFPSEVATATYTIGVNPVALGQKTYHLGNSLTDSINPWLEPIADSTGVDHRFARWTVPGSPIGYMWENRSKDVGVGTPPEAAAFDTFVRTYAPIDHLTVQPFADPLFETQGGAAVEIFQNAMRDSPALQPWIYAQWANQFASTDNGKQGYLVDGFARGVPNAGWPLPDKPVPETWQDTTTAQMRYYEAFRDYVDQRVDGKKVLIVPAGPALVELKRRMDQKLIPGMTDFFSSIFEDYLHLTEPGEYLVSLVFYSCFYRQTPEGRVTVKPAALTQQQATIFQQIAWEIASGYPQAGIVAP
jgi:hypothetical protein